MGLTESILDQIDQLGDWGLLATDANLVVTRWNRWLEQRSGLPAADVVGRPLLELFPDLVVRRMDRYFRQALGGQTVVLSQRFHKYTIPILPTADGATYGHLQQTSRIVPLMDGATVCGTLTLVEDVTERVAYEAELRARVKQQAAIAAVARSALGECDLGDLAREAVGQVGDTLDVDFVEIVELSQDGGTCALLAGKGWARSPVVNYRAAAVPRVRHLLAPGGPGTASHLSPEVLADDALLRDHGAADGLVAAVPGRERPIGLLGVYTRSPRRFPPGELLFVQAMADLLGVAAERKQLEGELRLRVRELAEGDQRKDEFLAMLAHELRNPLAPVRNGLQVLRAKCNADPDVDRLAEMMLRHVGQIVRLVEDLIDVSRITRGQITLRKERVNLASIIDQAVEATRAAIDARKQELSVNTPAAPVLLEADPARLAQVVENLLNNAVKYTDEGGRIWLEARREGGEAVISVRDTGVGISAEMLPKVFDLFTQVERTLDRSQGGLGVGLTLVRSLVELHAGTVHAFSAGPGQGSEFIVRLPALPAGTRFENQQPHEGTPPVATPLTPRSILIVDDNVDAADSLAMLLRLSGHQVWTAYGGLAALEAAKSHRPQVVLLDIGLPGMDGYEVAARLRRDSTSVSITLVALTGFGQEDDRRKTHAAGFDYHLVKPVSPGELAQLLAGITS
jgi:PAS domain S-box-containing protein